jgi:hypothetical protein
MFGIHGVLSSFPHHVCPIILLAPDQCVIAGWYASLEFRIGDVDHVDWPE